ncbi:syntaxin-61 [Canna indica]|uniref:Syntaxin-61 n=1 Tax=Canna indica TaxID=4628 RepID=A0AAQ3QPF7_9LILI|nr:syntaxin-61 [Canna indica]
MTPARDPFYIVKGEIQDSIDKLQANFLKWEQTPLDIAEHARLTREVLASCDSIEWQVDELEKAIAVAAKDPARFSLNETELENRRKWTRTSRDQVGVIRRTVQAETKGHSLTPSLNGVRQELLSLPNDYASTAGRLDHMSQDNDDFISSESDRQLLLMRQQDEELDELSASVQRIGGIGLTIHDELIGQERILDDLSLEMETTSNRLDFVQKKVAVVMKKAGAKGQIMMIGFLMVLFIILFVLVFFT